MKLQSYDRTVFLGVYFRQNFVKPRFLWKKTNLKGEIYPKRVIIYPNSHIIYPMGSDPEIAPEICKVLTYKNTSTKMRNEK
jgi:hypothetical protein